MKISSVLKAVQQTAERIIGESAAGFDRMFKAASAQQAEPQADSLRQSAFEPPRATGPPGDPVAAPTAATAQSNVEEATPERPNAEGAKPDSDEDQKNAVSPDPGGPEMTSAQVAAWLPIVQPTSQLTTPGKASTQDFTHGAALSLSSQTPTAVSPLTSAANRDAGLAASRVGEVGMVAVNVERVGTGPGILPEATIAALSPVEMRVSKGPSVSQFLMSQPMPLASDTLPPLITLGNALLQASLTPGDPLASGQAEPLVAEVPVAPSLSSSLSPAGRPETPDVPSVPSSASAFEASLGNAGDTPANPLLGRIPVSGVVAAEAIAAIDGALSETEMEDQPGTGNVADDAAFVRLSPGQEAGSATRLGPMDTAKIIQEPIVRETMKQIVDRIESLAARRPGGTVTIKLSPEELGTIVLTVRSFGARVDADIAASNGSVRQALDQNRQALVQSVESRGLSLNSMNVGDRSAAFTSEHAGTQQHPQSRQDFERASNLRHFREEPSLPVATRPTAVPRGNTSGMDLLI